ncbi:hypothetical protein CES85_3758 (plasmid) [Ochrobactrum quorumnocens]|uniref:Uncharacterized protein n=1 Tax=Ochrobactrum quorumnocens TaxID=271865 RepID=A0A248UMR8_9HYPH|nr:hypothetical protein CES85_3758 [[Ochrobactrum] quorumnocens]
MPSLEPFNGWKSYNFRIGGSGVQRTFRYPEFNTNGFVEAPLLCASEDFRALLIL